MRFVLSHPGQIALCLAASLILPLSAGCKSSGINRVSSLPGLGWMAQKDEGSSWASEDDEPSLPSPSEEATPRSSSSTAIAQRTFPNDKATYEAPADDYPNTGFAPYGNPSSQAPGDRYAQASSSAGNSSSDLSPREVGVAQQGFYGTEYHGGAADQADTSGYGQYAGTASNSYGDDQRLAADDNLSQDDLGGAYGGSDYEANAYSSYGADASSNYATAGTGEASRGYNDYPSSAGSAVNQYAQEVTDGVNRTGQQLQQWGENTQQRYEDAFQQSAQQVQQNVATAANGVQQDFQQGYRQLQQDTIDPLQQRTRDFAQTAEDQYRYTGNALDEQVNEIRNTATQSSDQFSQEARQTYENLAGSTRQHLQQSGQQLRDSVQRASSQLQNGYGQVRRSAEEVEQTLRGAAANLNPLTPQPNTGSNGQQYLTPGDPYQAPAESRSVPAPAERPAMQPWRPGGTRDFQTPGSGGTEAAPPVDSTAPPTGRLPATGYGQPSVG